MAGERVRRLVSSLSQSSAEALSSATGHKPYNKTSRSILADVAKTRENVGESKEPSTSYTELWDGLDACLDQANGTKQSSKDVATALVQWSTAEKEYIKNLPFTKKKFDLPPCESGTLGATLESFCSSFHKIATARARLSSVVGAMGSQLNQFRREQNLTKKKLEMEGTKLRRGMMAQEMTFQRAKQKYEKACKDAELCIQLKEKAHQEKALQEVSKLWQRTTDALIAVQESEQQYKLAVEELRAYRANYTAAMQRVLEEYQVLEESRVEYIKALVHGVVDSYTELAHQSQQVLDDMKEKVDETDSGKDIKDFVKRNMRPPMEPVTFEKHANPKIDAEIDILVGGGIMNPGAGIVNPGMTTSPVVSRSPLPPRPAGFGSPKSLESSSSPHSSFSSPPSQASQNESGSHAVAPVTGTPPRHQRSASHTIGMSTPPPPSTKTGAMFGMGSSKSSSFDLPPPIPSMPSTPNSCPASSPTPMTRAPVEIPKRPLFSGHSVPSRPVLGTTNGLEKNQHDDTSQSLGGDLDSSNSSSSQEEGETSVDPAEMEFVRVLYDYMAEEDTELTVRVGDIIKVIEKDASGWWEGKKKDGSVGSFPENYTQPVSIAQAIAYGFPISQKPGGNSKLSTTKVVENSQAPPPPALEPSAPEGACSSSEKEKPTCTEPLDPALNPCSNEAPCKQVIVIFDYEAQDPCDLTIRKRDILTVHGIDKDGGWMDASDAAGNRGMVPANYTRPVQPLSQSALSA